MLIEPENLGLVPLQRSSLRFQEMIDEAGLAGQKPADTPSEK